MFTRVVELVSKQGKARELSSTINDKIVPILKKQPGFADEIVLVADADSNRVLALSFWKTREDAERYQREQYNSFAKLCSPCSRPNRLSVRSRSIPQPGTGSPQAKPPDTNLNPSKRRASTGSPFILNST